MSAAASPETVANTTHETVVVSYDGLTKTFEVSPHEAVRALLEKALNAFGVHNNRHTQSLYTTNGSELPDSESLATAGVTAGAHLLLRPSQVKGGADASSRIAVNA